MKLVKYTLDKSLLIRLYYNRNLRGGQIDLLKLQGYKIDFLSKFFSLPESK